MIHWRPEKASGRFTRDHRIDSGDFAARQAKRAPVAAASHPPEPFSHSLGPWPTPPYWSGAGPLTGQHRARARQAVEAVDVPAYGRVEMWRGGCRSDISVPAPFVWRCLSPDISHHELASGHLMRQNWWVDLISPVQAALVGPPYARTESAPEGTRVACGGGRAGTRGG
jgi:hypothetical protein